MAMPQGMQPIPFAVSSDFTLSAIPSKIPQGKNDQWENVGEPIRISPPQPTQKNEQSPGLAEDSWRDLKAGVEQIPGAFTGLLDIPISAIFGVSKPISQGWEAIGERTGFQPGKWAKENEAALSPKRTAQMDAVSRAWDQAGGNELSQVIFDPQRWGELPDAWDKADAAAILKAYKENPRAPIGTVIQSLPSMLAGGFGGFLARSLAKVSGAVAAGIGEGALTAGQTMDQIDASADPRTAAMASTMAGAITGAIGGASGKLATKLGIPDVEVAMSGGKPTSATIPGVAARVPGAIAKESLLEEVPQSMQEQAWQNLAEGKPIGDQVLRQGIEGGIAGGVTGGGFALKGPIKATTNRFSGGADGSPGQGGVPPMGGPGATEGEYIPAGDQVPNENQIGYSGNIYDQQPASIGNQVREGDVLPPESLPNGQRLLPSPPIDGEVIGQAPALNRPSLPPPDMGGPTDRQVTTAIGLLNHSPRPSPELLGRLMGVNDTLAGMLYSHWEGSRNGAIDRLQSTEVAPQGGTGSGDVVPGSGVVHGDNGSGVALGFDQAPQVTTAGGEQATPVRDHVQELPVLTGEIVPPVTDRIDAAAAGADAFSLQSQSEQDLASEAQQRAEAEAQRQREEHAAEQKRQADAERGSFTLTGSDRPADVLAAQGQIGLFDSTAKGSDRRNGAVEPDISSGQNQGKQASAQEKPQDISTDKSGSNVPTEGSPFELPATIAGKPVTEISDKILEQLANSSQPAAEKAKKEVERRSRKKQQAVQEQPKPAGDAGVPDEQTKAASTIDAHQAFVKRVRAGEVTAEELKKAYADFNAARPAMEAELSQRTMKELAPNGSGGMRKAEVIGRIIDRMGGIFTLGKPVSWGMGAKGGYEGAVAKVVDGITDADLAKYAGDVQQAQAERAQAVEDAQKAIADPKTLDDYRTYIRAKKADGMTFNEARMSLTPEQRATFDDLTAAESRGERKASADRQRSDVRVAATTTDGQIIETKHTRDGYDLFVVKAAERVDREVYNQWNATAKRLGGWYSSFKGNGAIPGFQFKTKESAQAFLDFIGGKAEKAQEVVQARRDAFADDRSQSAVERLREMADKMEEQAQESLSAERKQNTERRARMAASAEAYARGQQAMADTMRNIATAIESGTAKFLDNVRQKIQVERLQTWLARAQYRQLAAEYPSYSDQEKHRGEAPTAATADYAEFPAFSAERSDLAAMGRRLEENDGTKKLGAQVLKIADDVSAEYLAFAKQNLHLVSTFKRSDGQPAVFTSRDGAEAAVKRSGFRGKAIVMQFKRGQNLIIMGPAMAKEHGVWEGDDYKRITLPPELGQEIVEKTKGKNFGVPYTFESSAADLSRLRAMGIETPAEFRAALREFVALRKAPKAEDRIKKLERAMIGRRNDGLDFFPTPTTVAQDMIDAADLKEGMAVLEPSAGMGHIADQIREAGVEPDVIEMSGERRELLEAKGYNVVGTDFLRFVGKPDAQTDVAQDRPIEKGSIEEWRPVVGYEDRYEVSSWGNIRRLFDVKGYKAGGQLNPSARKDGYLNVMLVKDGEATSRLVHQVVADAFLGEKPEGAHINHRHQDGDKSRNWASNLEYVTIAENNADQRAKRLADYATADRHPRSKLTWDNIPDIRERLKNGETHQRIGNDYGVTGGTISAVANGKTWVESQGHYDRIILNPPFSDRRDAQHVMHAYELLKPGGRLVAIMGEGVFFGQDGRAQAFRAWLDEVGGSSEQLPEGSFNDPSLPVTTSVNARMLVVDKPAGEEAPKGMESRRADRIEFAHQVLSDLAFEEEAFRYPVSKGGTIESVMADVFPGVESFGDVTLPDEKGETGADHRYGFATPEDKNGKRKQFFVFTTAKRVWINVFDLKPGDQGSRIYAAVANFAYNTGRVFGGDPAGVSPEAIMARTRMMLSSALRFGTTRHIEPSVEQERGIPEAMIEPLEWNGDDLAKTRALIHTFITTVQNNAPDIKNYGYDFQTRRWINHTTGLEFRPSGTAFNAALGEDQRRAAGIGEASGRAAILIQSLVSEEGRGIGDGGILQAVLNGARSLIAGGLRGFLSKTTPATAGVSVSGEATESVKAIRSVVESFKKQFKGATALDIKVVQTAGDIPAAFRPSPFAEGVYHDDAGLIYLVTANLRDATGKLDTKRAFQVLMHEAVGHYGLAKMMGERFQGILKRVLDAARAKGKVTEDTFKPGDADYATVEAVKLRYPDASDEEIAQEVLARMAETEPGRTLFGYVRAVIRQWVRDVARAIGIDVEMTTEELNDLMAKASAYMRRGDNLGAGDGAPFHGAGAAASVKRGMESRAHVTGDTGRYTADQMKTFRNVGRETDIPSIRERLEEYRKDFWKRMAQGFADQFAPLKALDPHAYLLSRLSKASDGALEAMMTFGKLFMRDGVYDVDAKDGGVIDKLLRPLGKEVDDFFWWVAGNRSAELMAQTANARNQGAQYLNQAEVLSAMAKENEKKAKDILHQAGNFTKHALGNQRAQRANSQQAEALFRESKRMAKEAAALRAKARELSSVSRENLMTPDDIKNLQALEKGNLDFDYTLPNGKTTRDRAEAYRAALKILNDFNRSVLDIAEQSGLINGEDRPVWESEFYVPFYREMEGDQPNFPRVGSGLVRQRAFERLKGGKEKLRNDLLANILQNWGHLLSASAKNRAARASLQAAEKAGVATFHETPQKGSVFYREDGHEWHFTVEDPFVMRAITALEFAGFSGPAMKVMMAFKRWLTMGVTASPGFKSYNLLRDSISAIAQGELSYNPITNLRQGFKGTDRESQTFASLLAGGGIIRFGTMLEGNRSDHVRRLVEKGVSLDTIIDDEAKWGAVWNRYIMPAIDAYNDLGDRSEGINRAALYEQQRAKGVSHAEASLEARDLLDFSMGGTFAAVRFLTAVVPFMNARIQGLYKLGRAAKDDPKRMGYVVGAVTLASLLLLGAYRDDEDWKKREDWDRDNYWWFKIGSLAFRIPKPFEIGAIGTLAERSAELLFDKEMDGKRFGDRLISMFSNTFAMNPVPQLLKPLHEIYANKDSFTGRQIEGPGMEKMLVADRYTNRTSSLAKLAGQAGVISPMQIDHLIKGYFGWLGTSAVTCVDQIVHLTDSNPRPSMQLRDIFLVGKFVETLPTNSSRYVTMMYDQVKEMEQYYESWRSKIKAGDQAGADALFESERDKITRYRELNNIRTAEGRYNAEARRIENDPKLTGKQKRDKLDAIAQEKNRLAKLVVGAGRQH